MLVGQCGRQNNDTPPHTHTHKDVHVLILKTYEYVTLRGKVDFADVIKVKDLEMGSTS